MRHEIGNVQRLLRLLEAVIVLLLFEGRSLRCSFPLDLFEVVTSGDQLDCFQSAFDRLIRYLDHGVLRALAAYYRTKMHAKSDSRVITTREHHAIHEFIDSQSVTFDQIRRCSVDLAYRAQNFDA